jgi:hypothetical protein
MPGRGVRSILKVRTKRKPPVYPLPHFAGEPVRGVGESYDSSNTVEPRRFAPVSEERSSYDGVQDMPIGICTVRPAFGKIHTMFQKTRIQGVPLASLED